MALDLTVQYRGPLSSCNYRCRYCPFASREDSVATLDEDQRALERFVKWVVESPERMSVFFVPRGEALVHTWYHQAIQKISCSTNANRVVAQTNLSCRLDWLVACDLDRVGLWCTYHPSQVTREVFLRQCNELDHLGVRYSVGSVGIIEDLDNIEQLRDRLSPDVYMWVNAYKREADYYDEKQIGRIERIDPWFRLNMPYYRSAGRVCRTGKSAIAVDGQGTIRRCWFDARILGNLYDSDLSTVLSESRCQMETCHCYVGYMNLDGIGIASIYEDRMLERIPTGWQGVHHKVFMELQPGVETIEQ